MTAKPGTDGRADPGPSHQDSPFGPSWAARQGSLPVEAAQPVQASLPKPTPAGARPCCHGGQAREEGPHAGSQPRGETVEVMETRMPPARCVSR